MLMIGKASAGRKVDETPCFGEPRWQQSSVFITGAGQHLPLITISMTALTKGYSRELLIQDAFKAGPLCLLIRIQ